MRKTLWVNGIALTAAALMSAAGPASATVADSMGYDSTFKVGVDIKPGVYTTTTAATVCAWARLSAITEDLSAVLESGGAINGKVTVEIKPGDIAFFTTGCGTWKLRTTTSINTGSGGSGSGGSGSGTGSS
ncbi:hypothetical protein [Nocardia acidivorans]|uniref:hypothetical protein n=1 Tax=Nocardia acidivorans TaxID=404580 RepID=UPI000831AE90|nr:hypothetical protein [Nocardia acidivorans]